MSATKIRSYDGDDVDDGNILLTGYNFGGYGYICATRPKDGLLFM